MSSFWKGFLPGLLTGAAIGLLLAPRQGPETRALVRQRFEEAWEAGREASQAQQDRLLARFRERIAPPAEEPPAS